MVDDIKDAPQDKPAVSTTGRTTTTATPASNKLKDVNIFPALTDRRGVPMTPRHETSRLGTQISIFCPVTFEEALDIVECLRGRAATTISLENMKKLDASRLVDFVAGASAALDGDFHKLSEQVYLFCPSNIKITAPAKEAAANAAATSGIISNPLGLNGELDFLYPSATATLGKASNNPFGAAQWPTTLQ